ncbi:hypothetical protein P8452_44108 [Trifolium repens]|jgi:hypothetical protein|nr:hypothetical protein QL285_029059 [Trifolium repens]WJX58679.1 hypothetical protein P8452_44108 [Trifolium repens]
MTSPLPEQPAYKDFPNQNGSDAGYDFPLRAVLIPVIVTLLIVILVLIVLIVRSRRRSKPEIELMELPPSQRIIWVPGRIEYWHQRSSSF